MADPPIPEVDFESLLAVAPGQGARARPVPMEFTVVRALTAEDLELVADRSTEVLPTPVPTLSSLRHSHHQLARLLASGVDVSEASFITGYSPATVYRLNSADPAFRELVAFYARERREMFTNTLERMRVLGLSTLDELQQRLEDSSAAFSVRELMEMAKMLLVEPGRGAPAGPGGGGPAGSGGTTINIKFVAGPQAVGNGPGMVIEGKANGTTG